MKSKLEKKYPLQFHRARRLTLRDLRRGVKFYESGGGFTHAVYHSDGHLDER